jgi:flagellar protein FlgJ
MIRATDSLGWAQALPLADLTTGKKEIAAESFAERLAMHEAASDPGGDPLKEAFRDFVGQTMFGQMLSSMRSTLGKPAYFHGGRGEEVFQQQLDQILVEEISKSSASTVADPMFELFQLQRSQ